MVRPRRPSAQTVLILGALAGEPTAWRYGYELGRQVGLKAGSLYPILIRLCDRGLLDAAWEADPQPGRPARHLYRLTGDGITWAGELATQPSPGRPAVLDCGRHEMAAVEKDWAARMLAAAARVMPAGRREWAWAMHAELAVIEARAERWSFVGGCLRASHMLRGLLHLLVVLGALGALLVWTATADYAPLSWILSTVASVLAAVCWQARRAGMLGPTGDGVAAWLLRGGGYLAAAAVVVVALAHAHPTTPAAVKAGNWLLAIFAVAGSFLIGLLVVGAGRSATRRALLTGAGSALAATAVWLIVVLAAPPIPDSVGRALAVTAGATVVAVLANSRTAQGSLLAGLLALAGTMALIFLSVELLAHLGPDSLIPDVTPGALPGQHISESRAEIVDPYVLILILSVMTATALGLAAVVTHRSAAALDTAAGPAAEPGSPGGAG